LCRSDFGMTARCNGRAAAASASAKVSWCPRAWHALMRHTDFEARTPIAPLNDMLISRQTRCGARPIQ
jgi:hypothetical protein